MRSSGYPPDWRDAPVPGQPRPPEYRDPWHTAGWFARLVTDEEPASAKDAAVFSSSGNPLGIVVILVAQAVLSVRLLGANSVSPLEGRSLWAGYLQAGHYITLGELHRLAASSAGSPEVYPPLGSLVAQSTSLTGARLLSLALMMLATCMLYGVTRRLWSSRFPAMFAAALFAGLGAVQFLGSYATYDAMALALLALATWLASRAVPASPARRAGLLTVAAICLVTANAAKYPTVFYDPLVILVAVAMASRAATRTTAAIIALMLTSVTALLDAGAYVLAGPDYRAGIRSALVPLAADSVPVTRLLDGTGWTAVAMIVIAVVAAAVITRRYKGVAAKLLAWLLAAAALLPAVLAVWAHSADGLYQDFALGAWFCCIVAGWGLAYAFDTLKIAGRVIATVALLAIAAIGFEASGTQFRAWSDSTAAAIELSQLAQRDGAFLSDDQGQLGYGLRTQILIPQWTGTASFSYADSRTKRQLAGAPAYAAAIRDRHFTVIVLDSQDTGAIATAIVADISKYRGYRKVASVPYTTSGRSGSYLFWVPTQ